MFGLKLSSFKQIQKANLNSVAIIYAQIVVYKYFLLIHSKSPITSELTKYVSLRENI